MEEEEAILYGARGWAAVSVKQQWEIPSAASGRMNWKPS